MSHPSFDQKLERAIRAQRSLQIKQFQIATKSRKTKAEPSESQFESKHLAIRLFMAIGNLFTRPQRSF